MGGDERLEISLEVVNDGEDAYEANFYLDLPESINYIKTELLEVSSQGGTSPPVLCSPPSQRNEHVLKCDLGNPMAGNSKVNIFRSKHSLELVNMQIFTIISSLYHPVQVSFRILLQPTVNFLEDVSSFEMSLAVNSSNQDSSDTAADNRVQFSLPVRVKTDLRIRG